MNSELIERLHVGSNELYDKRADHMRPYAALMREAADALSAHDSAQPVTKWVDGFRLSPEQIDDICSMAGEKIEDCRADIELIIADYEDDDGQIGYGLIVRMADYPSEGCFPLIDVDRNSVPASAPVCVWNKRIKDIGYGETMDFFDTTCGWDDAFHDDDVFYCAHCGGKIEWENSHD